MKKQKTPPPNCKACAYSYMDLDVNELICGHPMHGELGKYISVKTCGKGLPMFHQHLLRNPDGTLK